MELHGDGGGKAPALARALRGRARVAKTIRNWMRAAPKFEVGEIEPAEINGQPGAIVRRTDGSVLSVLSLEVADGRISRINGIVNPEKLTHL